MSAALALERVFAEVKGELVLDAPGGAFQLIARADRLERRLDGAVNIIFRDKLTDEEKKKAVDDYRKTFASPYKAAELGYIDEIIYPRQTRYKIIQALEMTQTKSKTNPPKKHGNIPL